MNRQKSKYWIALMFLPLLISCEKEVKNGIPDFEQKLVVTSFITPSKYDLNILVYSNRRIYGELGTAETLGDLTGSISDDTKEIALERTATGFKTHPSEMRIEEGKTYKLSVISNKGLATEASCFVPFTRKLQVEIDTFTVIKTGWWPAFTAKVSMTDFPGEVNYYRLYCEQKFYSRVTKLLLYARIYPDFTNEFFTDAGRDGQRIEIAALNIAGKTRSSLADSSVFIAYVFNTSKEYYDYHMSIKNYSGGDDPFTEVSPVYTNITGGLGIFAAYTTDSLATIIK